VVRFQGASVQVSGGQWSGFRGAVVRFQGPVTPESLNPWYLESLRFKYSPDLGVRHLGPMPLSEIKTFM
jgi:hypothetical protein